MAWLVHDEMEYSDWLRSRINFAEFLLLNIEQKTIVLY